MSKTLKLVVAAAILLVGVAVALYAYRSLILPEGRTPEGYRILTPMPGAGSFEPQHLPAAPVLENRSAHDLAIAFGYKVGGVPYSYALQLVFPPNGGDGKATLTARHATREAAVEIGAVRRWDGPRKAYAVALMQRFAIEPPVPALCIKAVIGPKTEAYDLADASICVAQRDAAGNCHPETLACGLIR